MRHLTSRTWSWTTWTLIALVVIGGAYLIYDHGQHLAPYLPYALLLGIFAMHVIPGGHGGRGGGGQSEHSDGGERDTAGAEKKTSGSTRH